MLVGSLVAIVTPMFEDGSLDYETLGEVLFRGQATVENGKFEINFIVPRDIVVPVGNGKISFYSKTDNPLSDQRPSSPYRGCICLLWWRCSFGNHGKSRSRPPICQLAATTMFQPRVRRQAYGKSRPCYFQKSCTGNKSWGSRQGRLALCSRTTYS